MGRSSLRIIALALMACGALALGCREEGPAERAGRNLDEAVESLTESGEGAFEKGGRKLDEAIDDTRRAVEDMGSED